MLPCPHPTQRKLGVEEGLELLVKRRGARPLGGGEVVLRVPVLRQMPPVSLTDEGEGGEGDGRVGGGEGGRGGGWGGVSARPLCTV